MKKLWNVLSTLLVLLGVLLSMLLPISASAETSDSGPDPNFHIYLAFGQSNTMGYSTIEPQDEVGDPRFLVMEARNDNANRALGEWYTATPPLAGMRLSFVDGFGHAMAESLPDNVRVGVIVVAVGGCSIKLFEKKRV